MPNPKKVQALLLCKSVGGTFATIAQLYYSSVTLLKSANDAKNSVNNIKHNQLTPGALRLECLSVLTNFQRGAISAVTLALVLASLKTSGATQTNQVNDPSSTKRPS